ncbi:hypothetical protein EJ06DRAFT_578158 [Trichodelitschia bisporula]|uniref:Uncharacterized protein n=1 Tax=Trichodelitschia bisporula TaxID=703511 RepID=A0A6G1IBT1_9PEZI|nr:hypothetical protein EJ06DRAFT_578158 [Trichodelitschia bisporula]
MPNNDPHPPKFQVERHKAVHINALVRASGGPRDQQPAIASLNHRKLSARSLIRPRPVSLPAVTMRLAHTLAQLLLASTALAGPLVARQDTSSTAAASTTTTTTSKDKSGTVTSSASAAATDKSTPFPTTTGEENDAPNTAIPKASVLPDGSFLNCKQSGPSPICGPANGTTVYVGETYYVTWDPDSFPNNATVTIALNYHNDTTRAAWTSAGTPKGMRFVTVTMNKDWLQGGGSANLTFAAISYSAASNHAAAPFPGPQVMLTNKPASHYEAPPKTSRPSNLSLLIGLPVSLGAVALILLGLFFGMRQTRGIGVGSVMGRRRGYDSGKSRRQRMGIKKGAIRLEEREVGGGFSDDVVAPAPLGRGERTESLGSLVGGENAFRREVEEQRARQ